MQIVSLGSSFAAGPGIKPVADRLAGRSERNYAHLLAAMTDAELIDASVSGATTAHILTTSQRVVVRRFPPQIEAVGPATDVVTVTAGGNDLGYIGTVMGTSWMRSLERRRLTRGLARRLGSRPQALPDEAGVEAVAASLAQVVAAVRARAPQARVILVDYLPLFESDAAADGFTAGDIAHFRAVAAALSAAFRGAAERSGADLVAAADLAGHGIGSTTPWVNGRARLGSSFHPNAAGMQGVAEVLRDRLARTP